MSRLFPARLAVVISATLLLQAVAAPGASANTTTSAFQVKYGGYLSLAFSKTGADGDYPHAAFYDILGGFYAAGVLSQKFTMTAELNYDKDGKFLVKQAWLGYAPSTSFSIKAGIYLVPFGAWNTANRPYEQALIQTPLEIKYAYPENWRDVGLVVGGTASMFTYSFYLGGGLKEADYLYEGQQLSDNNGKFAKGGRMVINFSSEIALGSSYYEGVYDDAGTRKLKMAGLDLSIITSQYELHGDYVKTIIGNPEPYENGKVQGFSVWMVMNFSGISPVASYQKMKYNDAYHDGGIDLNRGRWTAGFRWKMNTAFYIKAEYEWNKETPSLKNNGIFAQAVLAF